MTRKENILDYICKTDDDRKFVETLVDEMLFVEGQLSKLRTLPFIKINPQNHEQQKATPAAKQYKELLQQYTGIIRTLERGNRDYADNSESPLRKWVNEHVK